jgi:hypothetical protein
MPRSKIFIALVLCGSALTRGQDARPATPIEGRVLDEHGAPVRGARVTLWVPGSRGVNPRVLARTHPSFRERIAESKCDEAASVLSRADGTFRIGVADFAGEGELTAMIETPASTMIGRGTVSREDIADEVGPVEIKIERGPEPLTIAIAVTSDCAPAESATVTMREGYVARLDRSHWCASHEWGILDPRPPFCLSTYGEEWYDRTIACEVGTDATGTAVFQRVGKGHLNITVASPGKATIHDDVDPGPGATVERRYELATPEAPFEGTVRVDGRPVAGIEVTALEERARRFLPTATSTTDMEGRYRLRGLSAGRTYRVEFHSPVDELVDDASTIAAPNSRADVTLERAAALEARVTVDTTPAAITSFLGPVPESLPSVEKTEHTDFRTVMSKVREFLQRRRGRVNAWLHLERLTTEQGQETSDATSVFYFDLRERLELPPAHFLRLRAGRYRVRFEATAFNPKVIVEMLEPVAGEIVLEPGKTAKLELATRLHCR